MAVLSGSSFHFPESSAPRLKTEEGEAGVYKELTILETVSNEQLSQLQGQASIWHFGLFSSGMEKALLSVYERQ